MPKLQIPIPPPFVSLDNGPNRDRRASHGAGRVYLEAHGTQELLLTWLKNPNTVSLAGLV